MSMNFIWLIVVLMLVVALIISIAIHEMGHWVMAKRAGIKVETVSIGFGPKLFSFKWKGTEFKLCLFLIGGYNNAYGYEKLGPNDDPEDHKDFLPWDKDDSEAYCNKTFWQQFKVLIGGLAFNLIAIFIFFALSNLVGYSNDNVYRNGLFVSLRMIATINILIFITNSLPIPPLDCGRIIMLSFDKLKTKFGYAPTRLITKRKIEKISLVFLVSVIVLANAIIIYKYF